MFGLCVVVKGYKWYLCSIFFSTWFSRHFVFCNVCNHPMLWNLMEIRKFCFRWFYLLHIIFFHSYLFLLLNIFVFWYLYWYWYWYWYTDRPFMSAIFYLLTVCYLRILWLSWSQPLFRRALHCAHRMACFAGLAPTG